MRELIGDTETTGFTPGGIVELALVELIDLEPTGSFLHFYVNPGQPCEPGAYAVHQLTDAFLARQPRFSELGASVRDYIAGSPLVFHNAQFDMRFLNTEFTRLGYAGLAVRTICTKDRSRTTFGRAQTLDALVAHYRVPDLRKTAGGRHGALIDTLLLAQVYRAMRGHPVVEFDLTPYLGETNGQGERRESSTGVSAQAEVQPVPAPVGSGGGRAGDDLCSSAGADTAAQDGQPDAVEPTAGSYTGGCWYSGLIGGET